MRANEPCTIALLALTAIMTIAIPSRSEGKARFMDLSEAVAAADAVAVVRIESSAKVRGQKKGYWTYGQRNTFRFIELVKRAPFVVPPLDKQQILWAEKNFICASERARPGRYLLFLQSVEPGEWIPVNHYMGMLPIEQESVRWPYADKFDAVLTLAQAKAAVTTAKTAARGGVRFTADIVGTFKGLYNGWIPSRSHQVLVFHVDGAPPSPWMGELLFARAMVPRDVADRKDYESWIETDGRLAVVGEWVDGSLVIREARKLNAK
jgi:hypothetical protein